MLKSIYAPEYRVMVKLLRETREAKGLTQEQVAVKLGITPSTLSKWERCEQRLDLYQLSHYLDACGVEMLAFVKQWRAESKRIDSQAVTLVKGRPARSRR